MGKMTRKRYAVEFKTQVALDAIRGEHTLAERMEPPLYWHAYCVNRSDMTRRIACWSGGAGGILRGRSC